MNGMIVASLPDVESDDLPRIPGRIRVRDRAIEKVVRETSAVAIGVPRDDADVEIEEWGSGLSVRISAKLPIPDLWDAEAVRGEQPVLERARRLQRVLAEEFTRLTGREIRRVSFTVTGAAASRQKRVR
ncbi:NTP pyrophosphohydrolase [Gulosibacter sp. 10]|uniref:NTP pyrophosphohydrolase n=1 Tax=Gulosibacter sp. 10 TaxID=1255570 RepID=UPI000B34AD63|nr:NTP pyrophosphohydrolase [Gulosibacter sp. 10]